MGERGWGYPEATLNGVHALPEQVHAQLLEAGARNGGVEVDALEQGVDLNAGLRRARQGTLGTLAGRQQAAHCTGVVADVLLVLPLELLQDGDERSDH